MPFEDEEVLVGQEKIIDAAEDKQSDNQAGQSGPALGAQQLYAEQTKKQKIIKQSEPGDVRASAEEDPRIGAFAQVFAAIAPIYGAAQIGRAESGMFAGQHARQENASQDGDEGDQRGETRRRSRRIRDQHELLSWSAAREAASITLAVDSCLPSQTVCRHVSSDDAHCARRGFSGSAPGRQYGHRL